ncbi:MAG: DEAD/DEAH box helicase, partial [Nitrosopumilus sp.]
MTTFSELGIKQSILDGLKDIGFKEPFPIQVAAIPVLLSGRDVVGQAHTGTGKTAAFAISMLQSITPKKGVQGLVVAPTRELAIQITDEISKIARHTGIKATTVYGGQGMGIQLDKLRNGSEIVVATPGRLIDHLKRGSIKLDKITHLVLDEADTMLDMGFIEDIEFILDLTPKQKLMSLYSATMPPAILRLAENYLNEPKQFLLSADDLSGEGIEQAFLVIKDRDKLKHLINFIEENEKGQTIVFCSTKHRTRDVARNLSRTNFNVVAIEGDMSQHRREKSM